MTVICDSDMWYVTVTCDNDMGQWYVKVTCDIWRLHVTLTYDTDITQTFYDSQLFCECLAYPLDLIIALVMLTYLQLLDYDNHQHDLPVVVTNKIFPLSDETLEWFVSQVQPVGSKGALTAAINGVMSMIFCDGRVNWRKVAMVSCIINIIPDVDIHKLPEESSWGRLFGQCSRCSSVGGSPPLNQQAMTLRDDMTLFYFSD